MGIVIPLLLILFTCLIIWRACDGFEVASEYLGRNMSEGVRGGTINAISSSIPELMTTLIALFVLADEEGFSVGLGTTAGSALFNGMIIPALCILFVVGAVVAGKKVTAVKVSRKVILRDGLTLIFCNTVLIVLINGVTFFWWQGLILMVIYFIYMAYMILSMKQRSDDDSDADEDDDSQEDDDDPRSLFGNLMYWISGGPLMDLESLLIKDHHHEQIKSETWNPWPLLLVSTGCIGAACWLLVKACEWLGAGPEDPYTFLGGTYEGLGMSAMFVAVIFAAMATSVPDTIISIRDAQDGDYDDAVANALGSNIFDICFALGFPLFVYTLIHGPIQMPQPVAGESSEIRLLLLLFTIVGFFVYYFGRQEKADDGTSLVLMGRGKATLLLAIYAVFVVYVVGRGADAAWAQHMATWMQELLAVLPRPS